MKLEGKAKMLRVHLGEKEQWAGKPLYQAIVEKCRELDIAGATVYRAAEGYGASTRIRRGHFWQMPPDPPVMLTVIDTEEQIKKLLPELDKMVDSGLIALSDVEVIKYVHQAGQQA